ncbi:hypothetical protein ACSFA7_01925 [Variovorax sp. LT1R20]|uniref:hypothetical protein n=1 Tax=Variovorax sp. LT1R20 TaxID=3443729 RepID=UPI003F459DD0
MTAGPNNGTDKLRLTIYVAMLVVVAVPMLWFLIERVLVVLHVSWRPLDMTESLTPILLMSKFGLLANNGGAICPIHCGYDGLTIVLHVLALGLIARRVFLALSGRRRLPPESFKTLEAGMAGIAIALLVYSVWFVLTSLGVMFSVMLTMFFHTISFGFISNENEFSLLLLALAFWLTELKQLPLLPSPRRGAEAS